MTVQAGETAADVAHAWLLRQVVELPWDQDAFLSEGQVAEATKVSRTPVREALLRLEADGMIRRVPHRGAFIPALSQRDIEALFEAREVIEQWACAKASSVAAPTERLFELIELQRGHLDDAVTFNTHDVEFHTRIVQLGGNQIFADVYRSLRNRQLRLGVRAVVQAHGRSETVLDEHRAIAEAIRDGDPAAAGRAVTAHLTTTATALRSRGPYLAG